MDMRKILAKTLRLNEANVAHVAKAAVTLTAAEQSLLESLKGSQVFKAFPKDQIDRHTMKHLLVAISDQPVSVCERLANKCERLMEIGRLDENLSSKASLTEAEEVPVEKPEIKDGDGEMKQGPADSTAGEHDGKDVGKAAKPMPKGDADQGAEQDKEKHGDKKDTAKDGYMSESDDEDEEEMEPELENIDTEDPAKAGKPSKDLPEQEDEEDDEEEMEEADAPVAAPAAAPAAPPAKAPAAPQAPKAEAEDKDLPQAGAGEDPQLGEQDEEDADGEMKMESEDVPVDAKDPASDAAHRAANDATYKNGKKQNEAALKEDDLSRPDETKDASDLPCLDKVQKEDPSNSELNKGPADVKLESLDSIEARICDILREAKIVRGTKRWNEAYLRGWSLALEHRARKLAESK